MQPNRRITRPPTTGKAEGQKVVKVIGPARDTPFPLRIKVNRPPKERPKPAPPFEELRPFERQMEEFASGVANGKTRSSPPPNTI